MQVVEDEQERPALGRVAEEVGGGVEEAEAGRRRLWCERRRQVREEPA